MSAPPDFAPEKFAEHFLSLHKGDGKAAIKTLRAGRDVTHPYWAAVLAELRRLMR